MPAGGRGKGDGARCHGEPPLEHYSLTKQKHSLRHWQPQIIMDCSFIFFFLCICFEEIFQIGHLEELNSDRLLLAASARTKPSEAGNQFLLQPMYAFIHACIHSCMYSVRWGFILLFIPEGLEGINSEH